MRNIKMFEDFETPHAGTSHQSHSEKNNYMFFQHLRTIKDAINDILEMDQDQLDHLLSDGHAWAVDHITTAADDIEEVYHFLKNRVHGDDMETISADSVEFVEEPEEKEDSDEEDEDE